MKVRISAFLAFLLVILLSGWCESRAHAEERAKPKSRDRPPKSGESTERRRPEPRRESGQVSPRDHERGRQDDAKRRHPTPRRDPGRVERNDDQRPRRDDPKLRHPRPRYDRNPGRDYDRYHWNKYRDRRHWSRDRFPRHYYGPRLFGYRYYRGHLFGPHYRLWYRNRYTSWAFYWPYPYPPVLGCAWYWVPGERILVEDPETGEEYWEYYGYRYVYVCFD